MDRTSFILFIIQVTCIIQHAVGIEEFSLYDPMELHNTAINEYIQMKRVDPKVDFDKGTPLMKSIQEYAVKRLYARPDEDFILVDNMNQLTPTLPAPESDMILTATVTSTCTNTALTSSNSNSNNKDQDALVTSGSVSHNLAAVITLQEQISYGAISKAGGLPMSVSTSADTSSSSDDKSLSTSSSSSTSNGGWLKYAENKLKRENELDHYSVLWEWGTLLTEKSILNATRDSSITIDDDNDSSNNINMIPLKYNHTYHENILEDMKSWFTKGGGKLSYLDPLYNHDGHHFTLIANEDILSEDIVINIPFKLIMCRQTARNILIPKKSKYLGEELSKTFEKNELWGLALFLLHEYYKETAGNGSKWGPFIKTLHMRMLTTEIIQELKSTQSSKLIKDYLKGADSFLWWSTGSDGPCSPTTGICNTKPNDRFGGDHRFNSHQLRWAYFVVKQNAVKIKHLATGLEFLALVPYHNMLQQSLDSDTGGRLSFELDGSVTIKTGQDIVTGQPIQLFAGDLTDSEFFIRYFYLPSPSTPNPHNHFKLALPGALPKGSKFHYCMKGTAEQRNRDECKSAYRSDAMFWKSKVLTEWREKLNLPPRMQELRMWAQRLHLYGTEDEMKLMSAANHMIAGLPIPVDEMPAEEQLMLMGVASSTSEAALMVTGNRPPPQLYTAPDPDEDPEAKRAMEHLAVMALRTSTVVALGNDILNATQIVLNRTRDFFQHGILPMSGLDELDEFLLKKIGMLAHCGYEDDMKITHSNVTDELLCAMRVHLMNETEVHVFCPKDVLVWEDNCHNVEFANFTAISPNNEHLVIKTLRGTIEGMLHSYPHTPDEDIMILDKHDRGIHKLQPIKHSVVHLRLREKELLHSALLFLDEHEAKVHNNTISYQLDIKARERAEADKRDAEHKKFIEEIRQRAMLKEPVARIQVDITHPDTRELNKVNLTLEEGDDIQEVVTYFAREHNIPMKNIDNLEKALRSKIIHPKPLQLIYGVIVPSADRMILGIPEGTNATIETGVFCSRYHIKPYECDQLTKRVHIKLNLNDKYQRRILARLTVDAPDGRKLSFVLYEGQQHDLLQVASDFLQYYKMPINSATLVANEMFKRLPDTALQVPVSLTFQRSVGIRFFVEDNITSVVNGFIQHFDLDIQGDADNEQTIRQALLKRARYGMAPGTYLI